MECYRDSVDESELRIECMLRRYYINAGELRMKCYRVCVDEGELRMECYRVCVDEGDIVEYYRGLA